MSKKKSTSEKLKDDLVKKLSKNNIPLMEVLEKASISLEKLENAHPQTIKKFEKFVQRAIDLVKTREANIKYQAKRLDELKRHDKEQYMKYRKYLNNEYKHDKGRITAIKKELDEIVKSRADEQRKMTLWDNTNLKTREERDLGYELFLKGIDLLEKNSYRTISSDELKELVENLVSKGEKSKKAMEEMIYLTVREVTTNDKGNDKKYNEVLKKFKAYTFKRDEELKRKNRK